MLQQPLSAFAVLRSWELSVLVVPRKRLEVHLIKMLVMTA